MMHRAAASILLVALMSAPALVAQSVPPGATAQSLAGKWRACTSGEGQSWCVTFDFEINGDTLSGKNILEDGREFLLVQGRIQGDHVSFRSGNGCTDPKMAACLPVVYTGTFRGEDVWKLNVDVTDTPREEKYALTMTRVKGTSK
jgi:hypothetical protein